MTTDNYPQASSNYKLRLAKLRAYRLADRLARLLRMTPVCDMKEVVRRWNEYLPYYACGISQDCETWFWQMAGNRMQYACEALLDDPKRRTTLINSSECTLDLSEWRESCSRSVVWPFRLKAFNLALTVDPENQNLLVDA